MALKKDKHIGERARQLLKALVEHYIETGLPIGSRTLVEEAELLLSSATVRNVMASLEEKGYLRSPHTSAGRIPTQAGYRYFVDQLIDLRPLEGGELAALSGRLNRDMTAHEMVESTSGLLSDFTRLAGVVTLPRRAEAALRHLEFLPLAERRVLAILVLDDHEVENHVIHTHKQYTDVELREAANFIRFNYSGSTVPGIRKKIRASMKDDRQSVGSLMQTILELVDQAFKADEEADCIVAGQEHLLETASAEALLQLKDLFTAFSLKRDILDLLERCMSSDGLQLLIGDETGYQMLDDYTLITAPYRVNGAVMGMLGVIGPTRMAYRRVIPLVEAAANMLGSVMSSAIR